MEEWEEWLEKAKEHFSLGEDQLKIGGDSLKAQGHFTAAQSAVMISDAVFDAAMDHKLCSCDAGGSAGCPIHDRL